MKKYFPFIALVLMALIPLLGLNSYLMRILILVVMWSVIGMAWNLLGGYCGQVSFGHAAFFGVGAYTSGMLYSKLGISGWWGVPASIVVVTLFALVFGYVCLRLRGPYFALATLAIGVILRLKKEAVAAKLQPAVKKLSGLAGLIYWYGLYPLHSIIFRGMLAGIAARAASGGAQTPRRFTHEVLA